MSKVFISLLLFAVLAGIVLLPGMSSAHEHQSFRIGDREYSFTIGSLNEPVFVDDKTGVELRIAEANGADGEEEDSPVTGLDQTLKVEISAGDRKKVMDLSPAFGTPGAYRAPFYPTVATTYSYRIFGTINSVSVDLIFTCNPAGHPQVEEDASEAAISDGVIRTHKSGAFGCPRPKSDAAFPEPVSSWAELSDRVSTASDQGKSSSTMGTAGVVLGLIGTLAGVGAYMKSKKV